MLTLHSTRTKHGTDGELFKCTMSLVFVQCLTSAVFAKLSMLRLDKSEEPLLTLMYYMQYYA